MARVRRPRSVRAFVDSAMLESPHMSTNQILAALSTIIFSAACLTRTDVRTTTVFPAEIDSRGRASETIRLTFHAGTERAFVESRVSRFADEIVVRRYSDQKREQLRIQAGYVKSIELMTTEEKFNPAAALWIVPLALILGWGVLCATQCGGR